MDQAELSTDEVLRRYIPWEKYMTTKLISGTGLQLLRRYDNKSESQRATLLDDDGPAYVGVFVNILRDISKEDTIEYVFALVDEMLAANPKHAKLFHDNTLSGSDTYGSFLKWLWKGNWFIQEKSCKILSAIVSARPKAHLGILSNGEATNSKSVFASIDDVLRGLVEWLCSQLKNPSNPYQAVSIAINCLSTLLREPSVRCSFLQADGVKLLAPLISPASTQQSVQPFPSPLNRPLMETEKVGRLQREPYWMPTRTTHAYYGTTSLPPPEQVGAGSVIEWQLIKLPLSIVINSGCS